MKRARPKRKPRTQAQKVKRVLLARLRDMEDTLGGWKAEALITWLWPWVERSLTLSGGKGKGKKCK